MGRTRRRRGRLRSDCAPHPQEIRQRRTRARLPDRARRGVAGRLDRDARSEVDDESVDLIMTSPPFALQRPKEYGNESQEGYKNWFLPFADEFWRVLKPTGSLVIDLGGAWEGGQPVKSIYAVRAARQPLPPPEPAVRPSPGLLLVQPGSAAEPGAVGHRRAGPRQGRGQLRLVARRRRRIPRQTTAGSCASTPTR